MRKRIFALLLALVLTVGLLPTAAWAAEGEPHSHPVCGETCDHSSSTHETVTWTEWNGSSSLTTGSYYLSGDVDRSSTLTISGTVNLCLNGHVIKKTGNSRVITVNSGAALNICDCDTTTEHKFSVDGATGLWTLDEDGGTETVTGGVITGGIASVSSNTFVYGGGVLVDGGAFSLHGGSIIGNVVQTTAGGGNQYGGGVSVNDGGEFTMTGGAIAGNVSMKAQNGGILHGGGVSVINGSFTMSGGTISSNRCTNSANGSIHHGGGVWVSGPGTFTMTGGTISGNTADDGGGGMYSEGTFTMTGGEITGNSSKSGGGVFSGGTFAMSGGAITDNSSKSNGGGVFSGGTFTMTGGEITGNSSNSNGGGVYISGPSFTLSGSPTITGNKNGSADNNVYLDQYFEFDPEGPHLPPDEIEYFNRFITVDEDFAPSGKIGVITAIKPTCGKPTDITGANDKDYSQHFTSESEGCTVRNSGTNVVQLVKPHTWATAWTSDATGHWHKCTAAGCGITDYAACGETGAAYGAHTPGDWIIDQAATTEVVGSKHKACSVCGYTTETGTIPKLEPSHTHAWATAWTTSDTHHWHVCEGTGTCDISADSGKNGYGTHVWDNDQDTTCNTCGYTRTVTPAGHTHAWATAWTTNTTHHWHNCTAAGCTVTANTDKDGYGMHTWNDGVVTKEPTATAGGIKTFTCALCAATKTEPVPIPTFNVSGTVTDSEDTAVEGATVKLMRGSTQVASTTTDASGNYSFANVTPGSYNLVAEQTQDGSIKTMTILVTITNANLSNQNLAMPGGSVNSVLDVKGDDTPAVVVGGLEKEAEANKEEGNTVTVTMTVEAKAEAQAEKATEIKAAAGDKKLDYLEIKVTKTMEAGGPATTDEISTTNDLLTIIIPFDFSGKNKASVTVYRYHGSSVDTLTTTANAGGEKIELGTDSITLKAKNFSTYAIGYTETGSGGSSSGSGSGGHYSPTYSITLSDSVPNGAVGLSPKNARKGTTVTITVTPEEGYEIGTVTVTDKDGKEISVTGKGDGKYTFTMPAGKVNVSATFTKIRGGYANCPKDDTCPVWPYTDADITAWYHDGLHYCIVNGLMVGYDSHTFGPDGDTSRAMIATILWRLEGSPVMGNGKSGTFPDVPEDQWYTDAIEWAAAAGVVTGYGDGNFGPDNPITREQLAAMLYRFEQYKGGGFTGAWMFQLDYTDAQSVSSWAYEPMCWTTMNGIIRGIGDGLLNPKGNATRAEAATMLLRFLAGTKK